MREEIERIVGESKRFMTPLQIAHFVLEEASAGTWWGFYVQAARELSSRMSDLRRSVIEFEATRRKLERLKLPDFDPSMSREADGDSDLEVARVQLELEDSEQTLRERWEQAWLFFEHARHARAKLPRVLDPVTRDALDRKFWVCSVLKSGVVDFLRDGKVSGETWRMCLSLPLDMTRELSPQLLKIGTTDGVDWTYFKLEVPQIIPPQLPSLEEVKEVIEDAKALTAR